MKKPWLVIAAAIIVCGVACRPHGARDTTQSTSNRPMSTVPMPVLAGESLRPVFAVYKERSSEKAMVHGINDDIVVILALYRDGRLIYSAQSNDGGPPYGETKVGEDVIMRFVSDLDELGCFSKRVFQMSSLGPDSAVTTIACQVDERAFIMRSWHEHFESDERLVVTDHGVEPLGSRSRAEVLQGSTPDYQEFRRAWDALRRVATSLLPKARQATQRFQFTLDAR